MEKQLSTVAYWIGVISAVLALITRLLAVMGVLELPAQTLGKNPISYRSFLDRGNAVLCHGNCQFCGDVGQAAKVVESVSGHSRRRTEGTENIAPLGIVSSEAGFFVGARGTQSLPAIHYGILCRDQIHVVANHWRSASLPQQIDDMLRAGWHACTPLLHIGRCRCFPLKPAWRLDERLI